MPLLFLRLVNTQPKDKTKRINREESEKTNLIRDALRSVQSDVFHCRENIHFLLSLNLLGNIEGDTKQSTSFCTVPEMAVIVENLILDCFLSKCNSGSSGRVGGRGGAEGRWRETWNLCSGLWWSSFLWIIFAKIGRTCPPQVPLDPLLNCLKYYKEISSKYDQKTHVGNDNKFARCCVRFYTVHVETMDPMNFWPMVLLGQSSSNLLKHLTRTHADFYIEDSVNCHNTPLPRDDHCRRQCASYWNGFLLYKVGRIEPGTSCDPLWCFPNWAHLTLFVRLRLRILRYLYSLLILAEIQQSIGGQTKVNLNAPQLTLAKLVLEGIREQHKRSRFNPFFAEYIFFFPE